jgi:RecT family
MNALTEVPAATTALVPTDMDQAIRLAKAMSTAKMLPKHLWDDVGTCLMIVEQAMRWNMSPFAVAQCTSSIGGKLMYEGKLLAAAAESVGAIEGHFDYEFAGEGDDRQVTISARRRGDVNPRQMTIRLRDVRTTNEHWKKQPDQMLVYSGARNWTRRFTPSVLLGSYAPEEFNRDGKPAVDDFAGTTIEASPEREAINDEIPMRPAAATTPRSPRKVDPKVYDTPVANSSSQQNQKNGADRQHTDSAPVPRTLEQWNGWMDEFEPRLASLLDRRELNDMTKEPAISDAIAKAPPRVRKDIDALLAHAYGRLPEPDLSDEALGEVEIEGEDKVLAGD